MAFIDEGRRMSVINLELRVVNLRCGSRQRHKGARLSEGELWGVPAAGGWSRGRHCALLSSLCRLCILIPSTVIGVHGTVGFAADLSMHVLVAPFPSSLPRNRIPAPWQAPWSRETRGTSRGS